MRAWQTERVVVAYPNHILLDSTDDTEFKLSIFVIIAPLYTE